MVNDRQRQYLAALGIPVWRLRQPLAVQPQPVAEALSNPPGAACPPSLAQEGKADDPPSDTAAAMASPLPPEERLERSAGTEPEEAEWLATDDWTPPMDDDQEPLLETADASQSLAPSAPDRRTARIAGMDWEQLAAEIQQCTACSLCTTRTQTVFGVGNRQAEWLIIGEAPGADEDRQGEPFVGRAGKLLNPMLLAIGLKREQVFIANILKCRPPENRDPTPTEAASCRPFLERQIELIRPRIILAVGRIAAQNLLATDTQIGKLRGQVHRFGPARLPLIVTYHPAYLLRSPREKRKSWDDLRLAQRTLAAEPYNPAWKSAAP